MDAMHPDDATIPPDARQLSSREDQLVIPLHVEDVLVSKRRVDKSVVRIGTVTRHRDQLVEEQLSHERVEVEHVPIGRYVNSIPPVREQGDVTIMSVIEEVVVVERKLLLREEVHIRRVRTTEHHVETVKLREQEAVITRTPAGVPTTSAAPTPTNLSTLETEE